MEKILPAHDGKNSISLGVKGSKVWAVFCHNENPHQSDDLWGQQIPSDS